MEIERSNRLASNDLEAEHNDASGEEHDVLGSLSE